MKKTVEIKRPGMKRLDNSLHVQFHNETYDIVHAVDQTKLGMPADVMPEWRGNIDIEISNNRNAQADVNTALMMEKDEERDRLVIYIIATVRNALLLSDADIVAAAKRLSVVTRRYSGIQKGSLERETADIIGFLADLKDAKYASDITKLGLPSVINKLESVNTEFRNLYKERRDAGTEKKQLPPSGKVRPETDALYERVLLVLQWNYVYGAAPVDPDVIAQVVASMNDQTDRIETAYRQSLAQKKAAAEKKPKDPKQPKDPKDPKPKDPKDPKKPEGGGDDIQIPSEPPKKPDDAEQPKPNPGGGTGGSGDDIQIPTEPPKKPDGQ